MSLLFFFILLLTGLAVGYLYILALASLLPVPKLDRQHAPLDFAVVIPAHDEEAVIARTVRTILAAAYPADKLAVFVVADHCSDTTAQAARQAGAAVFERQDGPRGGKGAALSWLFTRLFAEQDRFDAVAVFDADTTVHPDFFTVMSARLSAGAQVVQGNHVIRNPGSGWFPRLTWAMFLIDNRVQNLGRANLGLSAKNMGDSICFRSAILRRFGWGSGLTEDYAFRQLLLLNGLRIAYEPRAAGYGDAAANWQEARAQRARWLRGAYQSSRRTARRLLVAGLRARDPALLDGALQAYLPSYSTLTLITAVFLLLAWLLSPWLWPWLPFAWTVLFVLIFLYPLLALACDRAPLSAYLVILTGPVFIFWRTWLSFQSRFLQRDVRWVRTPRHVNPSE